MARKNPNQIQKQIDDLKAITDGGGKLSRHEEQVFEGLQKELKAVTKAREALGDKAPSFGRGGFRSDSNVLGKRPRGSLDESSGDEDVPEDVRRIPMPRDTPPPIPKEVLDEWYSKRRARRAAEQAAKNPEGEKKKEAPVVEAKTVYEAKPVVRNLQKEAVTAFIPAAVQMKLNKGSGQGGLIEPEEADRLEQEGYMKSTNAAQASDSNPSRKVTIEDAEDDDDDA